MNISSATGIIRLLPSFLSGALLASFYKINLPVIAIILFCVLLLIFSQQWLIHSKKQYNYRWLIAGFIQLAVFFSALTVTALKSEIEYPGHFSNSKTSDCFSLIVNEEPVAKNNNLRFEGSIDQIKVNGHWKNASGRCLVYIKKDSLDHLPSYGDRLIFFETPRLISLSMNPGAFNFKAWLEYKQIYHQVYLKKNDFLLLTSSVGNIFMSTAIHWRKYLLSSIRTAGIHGQEEAVLSALILGQDDEIDSSLRQNYSTAGVMHILAVSGMHVGLIYGALCMLIGFPGKRKKHLWIKAIVLILCLWFYAMLTGLSPSVLRAAMMLSFLLVGVSLGRSSNAINVLCASAISLFLIFSPDLIYSAGFQLSFLAVAGILFLYKPFQSIIIPKGWLASKVWSLVSVSIVAQLATFPLSIYYFHRFPNYFILSNLLVIPIGTMVIFGGIIVLAFSWWPSAAFLFAKVLNLMIQLLNYSVCTLAELPGSATDGLFLSEPAVFFSYIAILFLALFLLKKNPKYLISCTLFLVFIMCLHCHRLFQTNNNNLFLVYHSPRHTYFQFVQGKTAVSFVDSVLACTQSKRNYVSENFMLTRNIIEEIIVPMTDSVVATKQLNNLTWKFPFIEFNRRKIYCLNPSNVYSKPGNPTLDVLLISGNPRLKLKTWLKNIECRNIIADASNSAYNRRLWQEECKELGIVFIDVSDSGACLMDSDGNIVQWREEKS